MKRLFLVDYDGVCVKPGQINIDSLKWKINDALQLFGQRVLSEDELSQLLTDTSGTTELNLLNSISNKYELPESMKLEFINMCMFLRQTHLSLVDRVEAKKIDPQLVDVTFGDALNFFRSQNNKDTRIRSVTGNPRSTMKERLRLNPEWGKIFKKGDNLPGAFGDEGLTRTELIELAIKREIESGFPAEFNPDGSYKNIFYFGDTVNDLAAGLKARVPTIFVPRDYSKPPDETTYSRLRKIINMDQSLSQDEKETGLKTDAIGIIRGSLYTTTFNNLDLIRFTRPDLWNKPRDLERLTENFHQLVEFNRGGFNMKAMRI